MARELGRKLGETLVVGASPLGALREDMMQTSHWLQHPFTAGNLALLKQAAARTEKLAQL